MHSNGPPTTSTKTVVHKELMQVTFYVQGALHLPMKRYSCTSHHTLSISSIPHDQHTSNVNVLLPTTEKLDPISKTRMLPRDSIFNLFSFVICILIVGEWNPTLSVYMYCCISCNIELDLF